MTHQEEKALRPSQIVNMMRPGERYSMIDLQKKLHRGDTVIRKVLQTMGEGTIDVTVESRTRYYSLPVDEAVAVPVLPGKYVPEWKELGLRDIGEHQRLCEGARNSETGMV